MNVLRIIVMILTGLWGMFCFGGVFFVKDWNGKIFFGIMFVLCALIVALLLI